MMPFFALVMIESRLIRMLDDMKAEYGEDTLAEMDQDDFIGMIRDKGQGYNVYIFERHKTLKDICANDKSFDIDFDAYLHGFDGETKDLLGVDASEGEKFLDIKGVISSLKLRKRYFLATPRNGARSISSPSTTPKSPRWKNTSSANGRTFPPKPPGSNTPRTT